VGKKIKFGVGVVLVAVAAAIAANIASQSGQNGKAQPITAKAPTETKSTAEGQAGRLAEPPAPSPEKVKAAVGKALPLLLKGAEGHRAEKTCFACHNQAIPLLAFTTAGGEASPCATRT
jgi:hypothetical protein